MTIRGLTDCFDVWERHVVYGGRLHLDPTYVERDRRKQAKAMRELVAAGYATETPEGTWEATSKAWDETPADPPDLYQAWLDSRNNWNQSAAPFVRYQLLLPGHRKAVVGGSASRWWLLHENLTTYRRRHDERDDYIKGPFPFGAELIQAFRDGMDRHSRGDRYELAVTTADMEDKVRAKRAEEQFDDLFRRNLAWGLQKVVGMCEADAEVIRSDDTPGWIGGGASGNLGAVPEQWGENMRRRVTELRDSIQRRQNMIRIFDNIIVAVEQMGGWNTFIERYKAAIREAMKEGK